MEEENLIILKKVDVGDSQHEILDTHKVDTITLFFKPIEVDVEGSIKGILKLL
ncbi:hypothetical protein KFK09_017319 [Dendrobium nobile]|uniref:Uncharacterized protein n=1 Tax=Dendrobium nobile TaxID=94219 RepID=A0A8T3B1X3_DENNO|nr:hypothetical protein KFK09_017319 [Dendrobium nobile]